MMRDELEARRDMTDLARELSGLLNKGLPVANVWRVEKAKEDRNDRAKLIRADGAAVMLWGSRYDHRVEVSGLFPMDGTRLMTARDWGVIPYNEKAPKITVARGRAAPAMAKDISTRFLTFYLPLYAAALVKKAEQDDWQARRDAVAKKLGEIAGEKPRQFQNEPGRAWTINLGCGDAEVRGDNSVRLTLDVNGDFAEKLVTFIRDNS